jgi:hypothetical protein
MALEDIVPAGRIILPADVDVIPISAHGGEIGDPRVPRQVESICPSPGLVALIIDVEVTGRVVGVYQVQTTQTVNVQRGVDGLAGGQGDIYGLRPSPALIEGKKDVVLSRSGVLPDGEERARQGIASDGGIARRSRTQTDVHGDGPGISVVRGGGIKGVVGGSEDSVEPGRKSESLDDDLVAVVEGRGLGHVRGCNLDRDLGPGGEGRKKEERKD